MTKPDTDGHLFVLPGDLTRLACDGWLLPVDRMIDVRPHWTRRARGLGSTWRVCYGGWGG